MTKIKTANAPCSWGALEFDLEGKSPDYKQVLTEIRETGYIGTELGDWGFMPTKPGELQKALSDHDLELLGAFVPVALFRKESHHKGVVKALQVAELMFKTGFKDALIVLADDNGTIENRTQNAGRIKPEMGLSEEQWRTFAEGAEEIAKAVKNSYGLRTVFHHHCAGYVETPQELEKLMSLTNPDLLGLCLDMGHYAFGGGDPLKALRQYYDRIWHIHFKDYSDVVGTESRAKGWDYFESVKNGVFCELGKGNVDFPSIVEELNKREYTGWIVVEQDVLPGMGKPKVCAQSNRDYLRSLEL